MCDINPLCDSLSVRLSVCHTRGPCLNGHDIEMPFALCDRAMLDVHSLSLSPSPPLSLSAVAELLVT